MKLFLKKNKNKKFVILDIPLLLENKLNKKSDILIFIYANKKNISKKLKKRKNFNLKLFYKFKKIQLPLAYKKQKSDFIIKNNFSKKGIKKDINNFGSYITNNYIYEKDIILKQMNNVPDDKKDQIIKGKLKILLFFKYSHC